MTVLNDVALRVFGDALDMLRDGAAVVTALSAEDGEQTLKLSFELTTVVAAPSAFACPNCGATKLTDAGDGQLLCLACSHNFPPTSAQEG